MTDHYLHLLPISGGYAAHLYNCRCEAVTNHRSDTQYVYPAASLARAVSWLYSDIGQVAPDRFTRAECAKGVPLDERSGMSRQEFEETLTVGAAANIWRRAQEAIHASKERGRIIMMRSGPGGGLPEEWMTEALAAIGCARYYAICVDGFPVEPGNPSDAEQIVLQAEEASREAMAVSLAKDAEVIDTRGARLFLNDARSALAPVHARRALADVAT